MKIIKMILVFASMLIIALIGSAELMILMFPLFILYPFFGDCSNKPWFKPFMWFINVYEKLEKKLDILKNSKI